MEELKLSIGKEERSLVLITNFINGYSSDFTFELPENFRDALDIKLTPRVIWGKNVNVYTQGRNFNFQDGDVIYDSKDAYIMEWGCALEKLKYCFQIQKARSAAAEVNEVWESLTPLKIKHSKVPDKEEVIERHMIITKYKYDPGYVKFKLFQPNDEKTELVEKEVFECTQESFVVLLQSGILRTIDKRKISFTPEKAVMEENYTDALTVDKLASSPVIQTSLF